MAMVTGAEYLKRIAQLESTIWIDGEFVKGKSTEHPAFKAVLEAKASLYDMVLDDDYADILQASDKNANFSFEIPRTKADLTKRRKATQLWAQSTLGVLGRSPEYVNTMIAIMAGAKDFFAEDGKEYGESIQSIYERAVKNDYTFTHTFVNPSISRKPFYPDGESVEQPVAAKIIEENEKGVVIDGARLLATQGGITDELLVLPSAAFVDSDYLFGCTVSSDTEGLLFLSRPSFGKETQFDYPLSATLEEGDAVVVFDHVFVPWERVFMYRNEWLMSQLFARTGIEAFLLYQAANRQIVKTEWLLGVAQALVDTLNIGQHTHVQGKVSEVIVALEAMRGFVYSAETQAQANEYEIMVPKLEPLKASACYFQMTYARLIEIIQLLGASHFISAPSKKDFASPIAGRLERFMRGEYTSAKEKTKLLRLARDLSISEFGSRQMLYERYFFGDPVRVASGLYHFADCQKQKYVEWVQTFLKKMD
ncbi:hypothetical protein CHH77_20080 [Shouchella clausii]|uniref:4-hydroxyphenylacetate 3-hydroxylase family protein n=1 Tax=Shouchella clausii TaxID=79880 RepID=UPI000BA53B4F|nr:4-hydroxyphenylacetate 3-hydroxylase N-terminal domain-containing protein [Shouchella clausii]PAE79417.1 hypothetical protein CHH77_20080 [Shouchella clausii]